MITEIYDRLHLDITEFDSEDVITTSLDPFEMDLNGDTNNGGSTNDGPNNIIP